MTYYRQPAIKESPYGVLVALYTFVAGLCGAAQVIAFLARKKTVERNGRIIAAAGAALVGPTLLILDLHTPRRWYNMLRIWRSTSPMSIGSYILTAFGAASVGALTPARRAAALPAAMAGAGMTFYTAPLLSSTATPLWAATPRALGAEFAASAFATGAAALVLGEHLAGRRDTAALDRIAATATAASLAAAASASSARRRRGVRGPRGRWGLVHKAGLALGMALPLACYASGRRPGTAAAAILAGTLLSRWALFKAGNASAQDGGEYLRFASHGRTRR